MVKVAVQTIIDALQAGDEVSLTGLGFFDVVTAKLGRA
jgi:nucleoid DNA-binding protein